VPVCVWAYVVPVADRGVAEVIPRGTVVLVLARDNYRCVLALPGCLGEATVADHRANRGAGGSKVLDNPSCLIAACALCNGAKEDAHGSVLVELRVRGVRVLKAGTNHATAARCRVTPVLYPDGVMRWLIEDGTLQAVITDRKEG
jgi:hypothetical protein